MIYIIKKKRWYRRWPFNILLSVPLTSVSVLSFQKADATRIRWVMTILVHTYSKPLHKGKHTSVLEWAMRSQKSAMIGSFNVTRFTIHAPYWMQLTFSLPILYSWSDSTCSLLFSSYTAHRLMQFCLDFGWCFTLKWVIRWIWVDHNWTINIINPTNL